jgi:flagellar basal body P-ring formation protein FlgA
VPPMLEEESNEQSTNNSVPLKIEMLCVISGKDYTLGDLARLDHIAKDRRVRLAALEIGRSPGLGSRMVLSSGQVEQALKRVGISEPEFDIEIPQRVTLERDVQELDVEAFRKRMIDQLLNKLPFEPQNVIVSRVNIPKSVRLPVGMVSERVTFRMPGRPTGTVMFDAEVMVDGVVQKRVTGSMSVDLWIDALRVRNTMSAGTPLNTSMLERARVRLSDVRGEPMQENDLRADLKLRRELKPGDILTKACVERQILVTQGGVVRMILKGNGMSIATVGVAKGRGSLGDFVEVANAKSGNSVRAVIVGPNVVQVPY